MKIGILSDTHNRVDMMTAAVRLLQQQGAQFIVHCGDVGGQGTIDQLVGIPSALVWGNCDWDRAAIQRYAKIVGVACYGAMAELDLDGKRIVVMHGDDHRVRQRILAEQRCDYLFQGHTHVPDDQRIGRVRLINPGALHRASVKTVALLETATDELRLLQVSPA